MQQCGHGIGSRLYCSRSRLRIWNLKYAKTIFGTLLRRVIARERIDHGIPAPGTLACLPWLL